MSTANGTPSLASGSNIDRNIDRQVRLARAYLMRVAEPPADAVAELVTEHGPAMAADLVRQRRVPAPAASQTEARYAVDRAADDLAAAASLGARLVIPEDDEWPDWPFAAFGPAAARGVAGAVAPLGLWARGPGRLDQLTGRAVAVVGARAATSYGEHVATELGYGLARRGWTVVSGAAYGIDGAAHKGALAADGDTIAVLACGVDQAYPAGHDALLRRIADHCLVVSEYPPGTRPARHRFLVRNRLIAALAAGVVVVEAGRRSGARNTAATAQALGRMVMAVPGPVTAASSVGCHELIRGDLAVLVGTVPEVIESVGEIGTDLATVPAGQRRPTDNLDDIEQRIHGALRVQAAHSAERIATESGVELTRVRSVLPRLERIGLAERTDTGWRLARAPALADPGCT